MAIDVGCGNGWVCRKLQSYENCSKVVGIDGSIEMIAKAKQRGTGEFHLAKLPDWKPPQKFNLIHSMEFLYYLKDPLEMLKIFFNEWLDDKGVLIAGVDHYLENHASHDWPESLNVHMTTLSEGQWKQGMIDAGFTRSRNTTCRHQARIRGYFSNLWTKVLKSSIFLIFKKLEWFDRFPETMSDPNITVKKEATVIEALCLLHPNAKKNSLRRMVDHGRVIADGVKVTRANDKVPAGVTITVLSKFDGDETVGKYKSSIPAPEVVYSDKSVIVVNKPAGLLSVATDRGEADTMFDRVFAWAWENGKTRAHLVHRLDRETSGCLILARSTEIRDMLQDQFKDRSIERIYHAVVHRKPPAKSGIETGRIQEMKDKRMRLVPEGRRAGKSAITNWWLEDTGPEHSLIRIKIDTGRRAQIRLHMANLGCPVIGDTRHGFGKASVNRLCLHASSLTFDHPNGKRMKIESPIPRQLISELKRRLG